MDVKTKDVEVVDMPSVSSPAGTVSFDVGAGDERVGCSVEMPGGF